MKNSALVVIDLQNDITKNYKEIIERVNQSIDMADANGLYIIYIQHNNLSAGTRTFKHGTRGAEFVPELKIVSSYIFTANIVPSTISVTTSFVAVYLTFRRSPFYALGYAANDVVLIVLWALASITDVHYISVVVCFAAFLINDIYGFLSWRKMKERQKADNANSAQKSAADHEKSLT